jgi:prevent-host-death family protein
MAQVEIDDPKTNLAQLVERARAGEDIIIARDGKPVARLVPLAGRNALAEVYGALRGQVHLADDFDELPDDIAAAFGVR